MACGCRSTAENERPPSELYRLDRYGFVQELVFAQATPRTGQFDDYTEGSYHVDKLDLLAGIRERRAAGAPILGVVIRGPIGPMWAYSVHLFIREGLNIRVNEIWVPHARITHKATTTIEAAAFDAVFLSISKCDALTAGAPSEPFKGSISTRVETDDIEWSYDLLAATWGGGEERVFTSTGLFSFGTPPSPSLLAIHELLQSVMSNAVATYSSDISDEESIYRPSESR